MASLQLVQDLVQKLSNREIDIVRAASFGKSCLQTGKELGTTQKTIQVQRHDIIRKLQCGNIAGAVGLLIRNGII